MQKQSIFKIQGMQRDLSASTFSPKYSYENKNIRIMSTDDNTLFSIVNEKGTLFTKIENIGDGIEGVPIGYSILNDNLILFTTSSQNAQVINDIEVEQTSIDDIIPLTLNIDITFEDKDSIYQLWMDGLKVQGSLLFQGKLNFNYKYPIETLSVYENEKSQKVYWVDGLNPARVINIVSNKQYNNDSFNFVKKVTIPEKVSIETINSGGNFSSGVIQYCITYVNTFMQESNIVYTSPLYYTSNNGMGSSPEESTNSSFRITIEGPDSTWDYIRVYSIFRTSINGTPEVKRVTDIEITESTSYSFIDNGNYGDIEDSTKLLYVGGVEAVFGTIEQKDKTLFL